MQIINNDILNNLDDIYFKGKDLFPNLFANNSKIKFNYKDVSLHYDDESLSFEYNDKGSYKCRNDCKCKINNNCDIINVLAKKYYIATNNGTNYIKWLSFFENNKVDGDDIGFTLQFGPCNTVCVGLIKLDLRTIKLIKRYFNNVIVHFNFYHDFSFDDKENNCAWQNSSPSLPSEYLKNLLPINRDVRIYTNNYFKIQKIYNGFKFTSDPLDQKYSFTIEDLTEGSKITKNDIALYVEPQSIIIWASFIDDKFKSLIKELLNDIGDIYDKGAVFDHMEKGESIYCWTNERDTDFDYNIFGKYLDNFSKYFKHLVLEPSVHYSVDF